MKVDENRIKYLADIAMISIDAEEREAQRRDLERIATYTEALCGIDTAGAPEQTHPFGNGMADGENSVNCFREDEVTNEDRTKELIAAAPDSKGPYFRVPRTIEE